jgi:hypothetical protein
MTTMRREVSLLSIHCLIALCRCHETSTPSVSLHHYSFSPLHPCSRAFFYHAQTEKDNAIGGNSNDFITCQNVGSVTL